MHGPTKFRNISLKPYFINNQELIPDSLAFTQVSPAVVPIIETVTTEISKTKTSLADIPPIELAAKLSSAILASLALVKQTYGQPKNYLE